MIRWLSTGYSLIHSFRPDWRTKKIIFHFQIQEEDHHYETYTSNIYFLSFFFKFEYNLFPSLCHFHHRHFTVKFIVKNPHLIFVSLRDNNEIFKIQIWVCLIFNDSWMRYYPFSFLTDTLKAFSMNCCGELWLKILQEMCTKVYKAIHKKVNPLQTSTQKTGTEKCFDIQPSNWICYFWFALSCRLESPVLEWELPLYISSPRLPSAHWREGYGENFWNPHMMWEELTVTFKRNILNKKTRIEI